MGILWVGHEAESYLLGAANVENTGIQDATYERTTMFVGRSNLVGTLTSTPDWAATDEIWHRFNHTIGGGSHGVGAVYWALYNAANQIIAQIIVASSTTAKFQVWNGAAFADVGTAFTLLAAGTKERWDIHFKGGAAGQVEVYYGAAGSQSKVVDASGAYGSATGSVRTYHNISGGSSFQQLVGHEIVQTTPTLNTTSEIKPPTSDGTDIDGGAGLWANVDEATFADSDLITLNAAAKRQSFKSAARTGTQAVVTGVTVSFRAWYEAGGPTSAKPYLTIGGVRYYGTTFALDVTAKGYQYTWQVNPATAVAFTTAEANAATLEWGVEAV